MKFNYMISFISVLLLISCTSKSSISSNSDNVFTGYYGTSFETSSFVPCPENGEPDQLPGYGVGYLLTATSDSRWQEKNDQIRPSLHMSQSRVEQVLVFIRAEGELREGGEQGYGHLGQYSGELLVTKVLELAPYAKGLCSLN